MIEYHGTIIYKDGRRELFEAAGAEVMDWEDYAHRHDYLLNPTAENIERFPIHRWQHFLAWSSLGIPEGFDTWRKTVKGVDLDVDVVQIPPTLPEVTAASWSSSPSASDGDFET